MFIKFSTVVCFQFLRKALGSVPDELCERCLPQTAPDRASPAALQDVTAGGRKGKVKTDQEKENKPPRSYYILSWGKLLREEAEMLQEPFQENQINGNDG